MNMELFKMIIANVSDEALDGIVDAFDTGDEWAAYHTADALQALRDEYTRRAEARNKIYQYRLALWNKSQSQGDTE